MDVTDLHLCPHREVLTTVGWAMSMWTDNRLTWDPAKFGNLDRIRISSSEVCFLILPCITWLHQQPQLLKDCLLSYF